MTQILLVDDEPHANALLGTLLKKHFSSLIRVVATAQSIQEARTFILSNKIDLVFLDIHMPEENGFSLFNYFPEPTFDVIFTTAYDNFAIQAFKYSAFDYLLKPLDLEALEKTIQRYLSKKTILRLQKEQISLLSSYINRSEEENKRMFFNTTSGIEMPFIKDILYIKADGNYCEMLLKSESGSRNIVVTQSLKEIQKRLPPTLFFKTHKSFIVALNAVIRYDKKEKIAHLTNGSKVEVSYRKEKLFLENFEKA